MVFTRRPFLVLGVLLLVWLLLPPVAGRLFRSASFETLAPSLRIASYARDLQEFWSLRTRSKQDLIAAGHMVVRYNSALEVRNNENELLRAEIARLESLLRIPSRGGYRYEVARVERREVTAWWQQCIIRKGSNYGIEVGAPVIFAGGVVGRVREVGAYSSVVDLLGSPSLRIAAVIEGDSRPVEYQGNVARPFQPAAGTVSYVPLDIEEREHIGPLRLFTSGLGGAFPDGLVVGTLSDLKRTPDGLFLSGTVNLDPRLDQVREVAVMIAEDSPRGR